MPNLLKTAIVIYLIAFLNQRALAQDHFTLSGTVPKRYEGVEITLKADDPAFQTLKTTAKNGKFCFTGQVSHEYERIFFSVSRNGKKLGGNIFFIRNTDMKIEILAFADRSPQCDIRYTNVPFIEEQRRYDSLIKPLSDRSSVAFNLLRQDDTSHYNRDSLTTVVRSLHQEIKRRKTAFIKSLPNAYFSLFLFNREILEDSDYRADSLLTIYTGFSSSVKETALGGVVYNSIKKKQTLAVNATMPDFSFTTNEGLLYTLSSFRNKNYVLLCFWDAACGPCIASIPLLTKLSKEYEKAGLQLISVSMDKDENRWLGALKKHKMPWLQTCDLPAYVKGPAVRSLYDNHYTPQYFLIDKAGKLIYHNGQMDDDDDYPILQKILSGLILSPEMPE